MSEPKHGAPAHPSEASEEPGLSTEPAEEPSPSANAAEEPVAPAGGTAGSHVAAGGPKHRRNLSWLAPLALLVALIAVGLAVWALLRPAGTPATPAAHFTDQQTADAKGHTCAAAKTVISAVSLQTHADIGTDPAAVQAVAANARLSMIGGGTYLVNNLDPATPAPLASAIRSFATDLQDISMNALAGVGNDDPAQANRLRDGETISTQIVDMCK